MRKPIFFLLTLAAIIFIEDPTAAQRCLPGEVGVGLSAGPVNGLLLRDKYGAWSYHTALSVVRYNTNRTRWVMGMDYLQSDRAYKSEIIRQQQYTVSAGYYVPVLSDRRSCVILSLGASALLGYEVANGGRRELIDGATLLNRNGFLYGGAVGLEIEAFASDRVALTAELRERIAGGSSFGACHTVIGIGIKFLIP